MRQWLTGPSPSQSQIAELCLKLTFSYVTMRPWDHSWNCESHNGNVRVEMSGYCIPFSCSQVYKGIFLLRLATKATPNETMNTRPPPTPARVYHLIMAVIIICNKHPTCTIVHSLEVTHEGRYNADVAKFSGMLALNVNMIKTLRMWTFRRS